MLRTKNRGRPRKKVCKVKKNISLDPTILKQAKKFFKKQGRSFSSGVEEFLKNIMEKSRV